MKASELIVKLSKLIQKHGDCDVHYIYDDYITVPANRIQHCKKIEENGYACEPEVLTNVFIINKHKNRE